jgi:biopolymer transport protein ExbD
MRLSLISCLVAVSIAAGLVQGCATKAKTTAIDVQVASGGQCQALEKSFACDDVAGVLTKAGISKAAPIQVKFVPGVTVREVITVMSSLNAAGFSGVSKTAGPSVTGKP